MNEFKERDGIRFSQIPLNHKKGTVSRQTVNPRGSSNTTMPLYKNKLIMKEKGCIVGVKQRLEQAISSTGNSLMGPTKETAIEATTKIITRGRCSDGGGTGNGNSCDILDRNRLLVVVLFAGRS